MNTLLRYIILFFAAGYPAALLFQAVGFELPGVQTVVAAYAGVALLLIAFSDYGRKPGRALGSQRAGRWHPVATTRARRLALASATRCAP